MDPRQILEDRLLRVLDYRAGERGEITDDDVTEILAAADEYAAAMVERHAHPPYRAPKARAS